MRPLAIVAAFLAAGCVSETRGGSSFDSSAEAAGRAGAGWGVETGGAAAAGRTGVDEEDGPSFIGLDRPDPDTVVTVPVENARPVDEFFDREGFLLGEDVEIDCSYEPFMARMVALAATNDAGKYVVRSDEQRDGVLIVRLTSTVGGTHQSSLAPRASFAPQREVVRDPATGEVAVRPAFEFVGARSVVVRLHLVPDPARPLWFRARAIGTPRREGDRVLPVATYMNPGTRRVARAAELRVDIEVRRAEDGRWKTTVREPDGGSAGGGR